MYVCMYVCMYVYVHTCIVVLTDLQDLLELRIIFHHYDGSITRGGHIETGLWSAGEVQSYCLTPGGREGGRERGREGGREGGKEGGREGGREGGGHTTRTVRCVHVCT